MMRTGKPGLGVMWRRLIVVVALGGVSGLVFVAGAFATGDVNAAACPAATEASPGFRPYLPDCRAYEMVTPVFKDGSELVIEGLSEEGANAIGYTLGGFAGTEADSNGSDGAVYGLSRLPSGWAVSALSPSSLLFSVQQWQAASSDLSRTLWVLRTPLESDVAENLYIREADGTMVKVGSMVPPAATAGPPSGRFQGLEDGRNVTFRGASSDLSHVWFSTYLGSELGLNWPGDETVGERSLYEYSGVGQARPELVGVSDGSTVVPGVNGGKPIAAGHVISQCGTFLGSHESDELYNAVSADGETVFFTAEQADCGGEAPAAREVYARLGRQKTVPVSEPTVQACSACDESTREPAEFTGASREGSHAFFMTDQSLLGGTTGTSLYEYDFQAQEGEQVRRASVGSLAAEVQGVARVSEDGSHVYFVAQGILTTEPDRSLPVGDQEALAGADNLYLYQRDGAYPAGRVSFIATLCSGEKESGTVTGVAQCPSSRSDEVDWRAVDQRPVQTTPDGRFVVFQSAADLAPGDTEGVTQVYEYDSVTGELVRVSREQTGYTPPEAKLSANENESMIPRQSYLAALTPTATSTSLAVSADGSTVVFESVAALAAQAERSAAAKVPSDYEYHNSVAGGGSIAAGNVYLISDGTNVLAFTQTLNGLDASGKDVFFTTGDQLVPQDTDSQFDTYDARVDGGFPAPDPPEGCAAEGCVGGLYAPPAAQQPGGSLVGGEGDMSGSAAPAPDAVAPRARVAPVLSRAQELAKALRACTMRPRGKRRARCRYAALARYGKHKHRVAASGSSNSRGVAG
jgi:hypothetical protein